MQQMLLTPRSVNRKLSPGCAVQQFTYLGERTMFDKIIEQSQNAFKPLSQLMTLNSKVMEEVAEKQKTFINDMVADSMAFAKELSAQKDFSGVYQTQKTYLEGMQGKVVAASTEAYELINTNQEKAGEVLKSATAAV
ncbi:MAG: phasin family protein [Lentisphaeria bacterium]|jgi:phasin family protein